ncbi:thioredoxin-like protein [Perkinsus sp. BL_2016]|nr:thioredoxin-like protein [Perkinsus sp. BL_2016]
MPAKAKDLNTVVSDEKEFETMVGNENDRRLHIVDIYARWCGPCVQLLPTLKTLQMNVDNFDERVNFIQVERKTIKAFSDKTKSSKPRFFFYKTGKLIKQIDGCNAPEILKTIDQLIPPLSADE